MELMLQIPLSLSRFLYYPRFFSNSHINSHVYRRRRSEAVKVASVTFPSNRLLGVGVARCSVQQHQSQVLKGEDKEEEENVKVSAVLFDMDGVLCNSEDPSRMAAVDFFAEMGVSVTTEDFIPFTGTGEANFLGGVAKMKGIKCFDPEAAKKRFFEIYLDKYAKPNSGIGFPGALELVQECKNKGLKVAVASSADRVKVDANLAAAGLPLSLFDAIISADAFENLKPSPDIFLAASKSLNTPPSECLVIEDALAGVQAAKAAQMRCIAVTTTLSLETLQHAGPSLIRKDIGNIFLQDILGRNCSEIKLSSDISGDLNQNSQSSDKNSISFMGLQGTRRDIVRFGSMGLALSCLAFSITNWKLSEPSGIVRAGNGRILIADTNNNAIRYLDLNAKNAELYTLELKGVPLSSPKVKSLGRRRQGMSSETVAIQTDGISSMDGNLYIKIAVPEGYHLSKEASSKFHVEVEPQSSATFEPSEGILDSKGSVSLHFRRASSSPAMARINCKVYYCKKDEVCLYEAFAFDVRFQQEAGAPDFSELTLCRTVKPKTLVSPSVLGS